MVGIVVVAHSRVLANAAVDLAREMLHDGEVRIAVAAGLDDTTFGTDAVQIQAAIDEVAGPDGVLVLMDLGSAVLSAEMALELLAPEVRAGVVLCPAPLVEGLVVATVIAAGGGSLDEVAAEASAALAGKQSHLSAEPAARSTQPTGAGSAQPPAAGLEEQPATGAAGQPGAAEAADAGAAGRPAAGVAEDAGTGPAAAVTDVFVLHNEHGLHARPAAKLVAAIRRLDAAVTLRNLTTGTAPVPADSLSRVSTLGASRGHRIEVAASGGHAREAIEHVLALASRHFDEAPDAGTPAPVVPTPPAAGTPAPSVGASTSAAALPGAAAPSAAASPGAPGGVGAGRQAPLPAAPGIALGPARHPVLGDVDVPDRTPGDPATEWAQLQEAVETVRRETVRLRARTAVELGESEAAIFDAHLMLLDDADLVDQLRRGIDAGQAAEVAWANVLRQLEDRMAGLADPYQRARAADVRGVADQVLRTLLGVPASAGSRDGVLVAADLTPAESANLDPEAVRGVALAYGSPTAHSAILARTRGIPMIVAAGPDVLSVPDGTILAFDGGTGELVIDPDRRTRDRFSERAEARSRAEAAARASAGGPARTADGVSIEVAANVGSLADATLAHSSGADAAGLVRTEFLFLDRATAPDIDEQEAAYRSLADALGGRRLTLRTFDVGGDKPLPYLPSATEANPFLGLRGIRLALSRRELLRDQLVAACRVARDAPVSLMFPMVSTVDELIAARGVLDEALATIGGPRPSGLRVGIMVEVPAAALKAAAFVPYVDFFSVGTNDLTQYTLAAERGNDAVARLADPLDPAVLRLIDLTCRAAAGRVEVGVCGEVAADDAAVPFLVGLGVRELSVAPAAVPMVKQAVRQVDTAAAARLARQAVDAARAEDVRALLAAG